MAPSSNSLFESISEKKLYRPYLDGLRGIAILSVLAFHTSLSVKAPFASEYLQRVLTAGSFGVPLFFMLSAFTLFYSAENRIKTEKYPKLNFYIRRFFRIWPFWWLNVFYNAILQHSSFKTIVLNLFFLFGFSWDLSSRVVPGSWSLFVEETFYLVFPLIFLNLRKWENTFFAFMVCLGIESIFYYVMNSIGYPPSVEQAWGNPLSRYYWFFAGILVFQIQQDQNLMTQLKSVTAGRFSSLDALMILGIFFIGAMPGNLIVFFFGLLFLACTNEVSIFGRFTRNSILRRFGVCCYSIYFLHFHLLRIMAPYRDWFFHWSGLENIPGELQFLILFPVMATVSLGVGTLSFVLIEKPTVRIGKKVITRLNEFLELRKVSPYRLNNLGD